MIKNKASLFRWDNFIFLLFVFLLFFKADGALHGNEVSGIFYSLFYRLGWQYLPSIFLYGHEPARGLVELPFIFLGPNEFILRFPNLIMALISFFILKKTIRLLTNNQLIVSLILLFYSTSGIVILSRLTNGTPGFFLFICLTVFYFLKFLKKENFKDLTKSFIYLFISLLFYIDSIFLLPGIGLNLIWKYKKKVFKKEIIKSFLIFFILFSLFISLCTFIPYFAAQKGYINLVDLKEFGFFRILNRGREGFNLNAFKSIEVLNLYSPFIFNLALLALFLVSFSEKWGKKYGAIFLLPLFYFSFHRSPTVHFLHFLPLIMIGASLGLKKLLAFNKLGVILAVLLLALFNLHFIKRFYFPERIDFTQASKGYYLSSDLLKAAGFIIRENSLCSEQVFTNIDAFIALFYTGLPDKKNLGASNYVLLLNDRLEKTEFNYSYQIKDNLNNYINIYSRKKLEISSFELKNLRKKFIQKYNRPTDLFPNIQCNNYR